MTSLMRLPRVVIFDFNGTLFDDLHVAYGSVQEIFKTYGISCPTLEEYREEISADYMEFYCSHGLPRITSPDEINAIRNRFYKTNSESAQIRPDVGQTLYELRVCSVRVAIVSAESSINLYRQLIRCGNFQKDFDFIKAEAWGDKGKEKAFLQAIEIFGNSPDEMIYVDDSVDGLISAKRTGLVPVAFTNSTGYNSKDRLAKVAEFSIQEIRQLGRLMLDGLS